MGSPFGVPAWVANAGGSPIVPDPLLLNDGTEADPTYSFASDPNTGFFLGTAAQIEVTTNGTAHFHFDNTAFGGITPGGPRILDRLAKGPFDPV